jgi:hypothetical protein
MTDQCEPDSAYVYILRLGIGIGIGIGLGPIGFAYFFMLDCCKYKACDCKAVRKDVNSTPSDDHEDHSGSVEPANVDSNLCFPQSPAKITTTAMPPDSTIVTVDSSSQPRNSMEDSPTNQAGNSYDANVDIEDPKTLFCSRILHTTKEDQTRTRPVGEWGELDTNKQGKPKKVMVFIPEIIFIALTLLFNLGYRVYFIATQFMQRNWGNPVLFLLDFIIMFIMYRRKQYLPGCMYNEVHALIYRRAFFQVGAGQAKRKLFAHNLVTSS